MARPTPEEAAAALGEAEALRTSLVGGLRLPSLFHASIGAAVAIQIATLALGLAADNTGPPGLWLVAAGVVVFAGVAVLQLWRFRRTNGVWVGGLASRAVLGTSTSASLAEAGAAGAAIWAAFAGHPWLAVAAAAAGGVAYAWSGYRWMRAYAADPVTEGRGESTTWLVVLVVATLSGLVALVLGR